MIRAAVAALRPVYREAAILYYRWALHDMQTKGSNDPDMGVVIVRLRDLRAERHVAPPSLVRRLVRWL